jgi:hypothetical protein
LSAAGTKEKLELFFSPQQTREALASVGYITDEITATVVHLAARLNKPVLLEGPPGSGKTELAYAVSRAISTDVERLQCFEGINEEKAIGKFDESLQRLAVELQAKSGPVEWEPLKQELHGLKFFSAGPLLRALQYRSRCVLLIDELDKVSQAFEAQAFKRACSCFGLGRYLYHFTGTWVDLDDRKRPKTTPKLAGWATPEGWRQGLRPQKGENRQSAKTETEAASRRGADSGGSPDAANVEYGELVRQIESMAQPLGRGLYRGLLKAVRAWNPSDIKDAAQLRKLLAQMQAADRGLRRLEAALDRTGLEPLASILQSMDVKSMNHLNNLEALHKIVLALEAKAAMLSQR